MKIDKQIRRGIAIAFILTSLGMAQVCHAYWDTWGASIRHNGRVTVVTGENMLPAQDPNFYSGYFDVLTHDNVTTYCNALVANNVRALRILWTTNSLKTTAISSSVYAAVNSNNPAMLTHGSNTTYWELYTNTVNAITATGLKVEICSYNGGSMMGSLSAFTTTWTGVVNAFKGNDNVFGYELVNEPAQASFGNSSSTYYSDMQSLGNAIHSADTNKLVIAMPYASWADCSDIIGNLNFSGHLVMSIHLYEPWGDETGAWITNQVSAASSGHTPVMVTETDFPYDGTEFNEPYASFCHGVAYYQVPLMTYWPYYLRYDSLTTWSTDYAVFMSFLYPPVENGAYKIVNRNSGLVLEDVAWHSTNGSAVDTWSYVSQSNEQWTLTYLGYLGTNQYEIANVNSHLALEDHGWSTANGGTIDQWTFANQANLQWGIAPTSGGYYVITNTYSGKAIEVVGGGITNGSPIDQWSYSGSASQQWTFGSP